MAKKNFKIKSVDEVKVVNRNYNLYIDRAGYLSESGKLVYVRVTSIIIDLKAQSAITTLLDMEGSEYKRQEGFLLYNSPDDFEANQPIDAYHHAVIGLINYNISKFSDSASVIPKKEGDTSEFCYAGGYIFRDNDALFVPFEINKIEWKYGKWSVVDGSIPDVYYRSREDAFSFNEYKVLDEDGEEFLERGNNLRLKLTDEQKALVEELRKCFHKAQQAGVNFIWDRECCGFIEAYNGNEVTEFGYNDGGLTEDGDNVDISEVETYNTGIDFYDFNSCEDYSFVFKKTPRQLKAWKKSHPED